MAKINEEILRVIQYPITEKLFKEKIGSGDDLKELVNEGRLVASYDGLLFEGYELAAGYKDEIVRVYPEKKEIHEKLLEEYYDPVLKDNSITDFMDFMGKYLYYTGAVFHLLALQRFDEAAGLIFDIGKKMIVWEKKRLLRRLLDYLHSDNINEENYLKKIYFDLYMKIFAGMDLDKKSKLDFDGEFLYMHKLEALDVPFYLEALNLEAIYARLVKNDIPQAVQLHGIVNDYPFNGGAAKVETISLIRGKNLLNLALCYEKLGDYGDMTNALSQAENAIVQSKDNFEIARFYLYETILLYRYPELKLDPECVSQLKAVLKGMRFPDIERMLYHQEAAQALNDKRFEDYFCLQTGILDCDMVLSGDYFYVDFLALVDKIAKNVTEHRPEVLKGLDILSEYMVKTPMEDEYKFFNALKDYLTGGDISGIQGFFKESNRGLAALLEGFINKKSIRG